jgi:probable HAF family extracellular repeat protein
MIAINDRGEAVGYGVSINSGESHGFLVRRGKVTALGSLIPVAINDVGQVVGSREPIGGERAYLWQRGHGRYLGALPGRANSRATATNNHQQVIGDAWAQRNGSDLEVSPHAFLWQAGKMTDLGTLGGQSSSAIAINERGQVVGWSETASGKRHAFLWQKGRMRDLGTLPDQSYSEAVGLNERGQVIGNSYTSLRTDPSSSSQTKLGLHAVVWRDGKIGALDSSLKGAASTAVAINNRGQIIGNTLSVDVGRAACGPPFDPAQPCRSRGFLWHAGHATLLSLPHWSWVEQSTALAINQRGQIVGWVGTVGASEAGPLAERQADRPSLTRRRRPRRRSQRKRGERTRPDRRWTQRDNGLHSRCPVDTWPLGEAAFSEAGLPRCGRARRRRSVHRAAVVARVA